MSPLPSGLVSFLMTDIEGSTELLRRLGKDDYEGLLEKHRTALAEAVDEFAGRTVDTQGDATFAAFGRPSDAVRAAAAAQRTLGTVDWPGGAPPRVRMGVHTGEATPSGDNYHGLAVHRAARICAEASGGQVLVSDSTLSVLQDSHEDLSGLRLVEVGERRLKDFEQPVRLHQIVDPAVDGAELPGKIGVLVVDDQALVRAGFRMILDAEKDIDVVGEAADGAEAVDAAVRTKPDVILMDVRMPNVDGLEATRRVLEGQTEGPRILILTTSTSTSTCTRLCALARAASS